MNREFRAHPLMFFQQMKPFLFVLVLPLVKGAIQYVISRKITGIVSWELVAAALITAVAVLRCRAFRLICRDGTITVSSGFLLKTRAVIAIGRLSCLQSEQSPLDALFSAVTYRINTEAGLRSRPDFEFKLSKKDGKAVSEVLGEKERQITVKFSAVRTAVMAATTSSAVTGMIVAVPILNRAGKLLGIALNELLLNEINQVSEKLQTYFPPIVNAVTLLFLLAYAVSFLYSLFRYLNFKVVLSERKIEVESGFFVRMKTSFQKRAVNNVCIEQTPLMHLFKRYAMKVGVAGYGDSKRRAAVLVPSGRREEIKRQFSLYFPFLAPNGALLHAKQNKETRNRFLFWPATAFFFTTVATCVLLWKFEQFSRLILFLNLVIDGMLLYWARLSIFEYKLSKLRLGSTVSAHSVQGFRTCELYCPRENIAHLKLICNLPDRRHGTCKAILTVRSENGDRIRIRHLNYQAVLAAAKECWKLGE